MARPTKLTPEIRTMVVTAIKAGSYAEIAAAHAGIGESTYYLWMARGRAELARQHEADQALAALIAQDPAPGKDEIKTARHAARPKPTERIFVEFLEAVSRASADAEVHAAAIVRKAMTGDWKAAAWYLERRNPDRWRRRTDAVLHHEGPASETGGPVQIVAAVHDPAKPHDEEVARAAHDFLRLAGRAPAAPVDAGD